MRFLADESCDFRVTRALRAAGHDVVAVAEVAAGAEDGAIIEMAMNQGRIFVTEDRDFGQLVYAAAESATASRLAPNARADLPTIVADLVAEHGDKLAERFVVVQPGRIRFARD